jgi:NADH-quinone oxidoreductase subunit D
VPIKAEPVEVNIGPQHPSTHGVFRMVAKIDGERVVDVKMIVGYLHRSMEKLAEERTYTQNIPFTDRMDYLAAMTGNLGYCLSVEKLAGVEVPERAQYLRTIFAELQRIASHCMATGAFINDCGAWQTPVMWCFRDREKVLDLFEMTCGARITTNYMRIGGVAFDIPEEFLPALDRLINEDLPARFEELENLIVGNEIILMRARDVGVVSPEVAINASLSGPMLRSAGIAWDIRKADPYCVYDRMTFDIPVGYNGDSYDRMVIRIEEMKQSMRIIRQCVHDLPAGPHKVDVPLALRPPPGEAYSRVESPKGELGFYVVSDGGPAPYRWHVRAPSLINLSVLPQMTIGQTIADAIVTLGSIDINVGEVDR